MDILALQCEVNQLRSKSNILCFLLYGSILKESDQSRIKDTDIILVLRDLSFDSSDIFEFIHKRFYNPDFHVYGAEELRSGLSHFTREYVMEYLAKAKCLFGTNVFVDLFSQVSTRQYKESILIRSIEHTQMVRKVFFSTKYTTEHKIEYLRKYIIRLSRNILLFKKLASYTELDKLSDVEIVEMVQVIIKTEESFAELLQSAYLPSLYKLFVMTSAFLLECKNEVTNEIL